MTLAVNLPLVPLVSLIPVANLLAVSLHRGKFSSSVLDTSGKFATGGK
jgi:hypothetical protein